MYCLFVALYFGKVGGSSRNEESSSRSISSETELVMLDSPGNTNPLMNNFLTAGRLERRWRLTGAGCAERKCRADSDI